jgi:hypothetical protein
LLTLTAGIAAVGIAHQATWFVTNNEPLVQGITRTAAPATQSINNMKNIGLAAHGFHDANKGLPAGGTFDTQGRGLHGWQTLILPYIDQAALHAKIDLQQRWNSPRNRELMKQRLSFYQHPIVDQRESNGYALSHYAGNSHVLGIQPLKLADITDGSSNTVLLGEVAALYKPWGMPMNCRNPMTGLNVAEGFANPQGRAVMLTFTDATVRAVRPTISPEILRAISTPRGGEEIDLERLD